MTAMEFVKESGLAVSEGDFARWVEDFKAEMTAGLAGEKSSLRMIPTYLSVEALPRGGESAIVLDAGGTNLRVALMEFGPQGPKETYFQKVPMLGTQERLTIEEFYDALAELLAPVADKAHHIGFCFSFPCEILPDLDGKILHFDKEVDIPDAAGSILGQGLREALKRRGQKCDHSVVVINDTVAAMLGAMAQGAGGAGAYMGFILGTGTNICASFANATITKVPALASRGGTTVVNLESGGFDKLARTDVDLALDAAAANPGDQVLEKLISGAYQGPLALAYLREAGKAGVFGPEVSRRLSALPSLTAQDLSAFVTTPERPGVLSDLAATSGEREGLLTILDAFFRRSARLTAATLCAVLEATGQAGDPRYPVNIAAEGTTFYKSERLHRYLLEDMETLGAKKLGLYSRFVQGENPNLTGSALAALAK